MQRQSTRKFDEKIRSSDHAKYLCLAIWLTESCFQNDPFILSRFLIQGHERMEPVPAVTVEGKGTPWTGLQCTAGRTQRRRQSFMLTFSPTANLDSPINLISMFLDYTVLEHTQRESHTNDSKQKLNE